MQRPGNLALTRVLVRQEAPDLGMTQNGCEELGSDIGAEQPLPVFRERRMIPNGVIKHAYCNWC